MKNGIILFAAFVGQTLRAVGLLPLDTTEGRGWVPERGTRHRRAPGGAGASPTGAVSPR